jgi:hypothetical protein
LKLHIIQISLALSCFLPLINHFHFTCITRMKSQLLMLMLKSLRKYSFYLHRSLSSTL